MSPTSPRPNQREFFRLAVPNVLTNLTVPLASLIDLAILGHLEAVTVLAGVALGSLIFDILYWSFGFLRMSTTALVANALGSGDKEASAGVFFRTFAVALASGGLLVAAQVPLAILGFGLLDGGAEVEAQASAYFYARIWGAPTTLGGYVLVGWLLGRQKARAALVYSAVMNGMNIILDWFLIYVLGMGAAGAGYATMASSVSAFVCGVLLVRRYWDGDPGFALRFIRSGWRNLLGFQANIFVRTFCLVLSFALFTNFSAMFGTVVLAGNTVLIRLLNAAAWFIDGYAFALESLAGKYSGAGEEGAVRRSLRLSLIWNTLTVAVFILGFILFGGEIIGGLTKHQDVVDHGIRFLPWVCICLVFSGFAYIYDGYFIGLAKGKILRDSMVLSTVLGFLPFVSLAVLWQKPVLLWWGMTGFMVLRALTLGWHARHGGSVTRSY